jgi:rhamnulokinase
VRDRDPLSLGVDTWGVDYGLIGGGGRLLGNPYHYRDSRTDGIPEELFRLIGTNEIYASTGIQMMQINTIFQLYAERKENPALFASAERMAMTPDLLNYFLTGILRSELSIASTSSLLDPLRRDWHWELIDTLGYPRGLFSKIISPGELLGPLSPEVQSATGLGEVAVTAVASHDTQSAVAAIPAEDADFLYLSSGTWSLMGVETDNPVLTPEAQSFGFTNEIGAGGKVCLLTNIMGLWLLQECKRSWDLEGRVLSYDELVEAAVKAKPFRAFIDPMDTRYTAPDNMPRAIREQCKEAGFPVPGTEGELCRVLFESLALTYRRTAERIEELTGREYRVLHIVGGGVRNRLLCQMSADACGKRVVAGPAEATALGNILVQAIGQRQIDGTAEGRRMVAAAVRPEIFEPGDRESWNKAYSRFCGLFHG